MVALGRGGEAGGVGLLEAGAGALGGVRRGAGPLEAGAGALVGVGCGVGPLEAGASALGGVGTLGRARGCCCRGKEKWKQDG